MVSPTLGVVELTVSPRAVAMEQVPVPELPATEMTTADELFAEFGSVDDADSAMVAVLLIVVLAVPALTVAAIVSVAFEFAVTVPMVQIPVELVYEVPADDVALTNVSPEGKTSFATTPVEVAGPRSVAVSV
jgi:hypothetical protein